MKLLRRYLPNATWLCLVAALALALVPTVSHGLAHALARAGGNGAGWAEVCTPQGLRMVAFIGAEPGDEVPLRANRHQGHCAYCAWSAGDSPLPAAVAVLAPLRMSPPSSELPRAEPSPAAPAWPAALSRAPPLLST